MLVSLTCAHRTKCYYFVAVSQMDGDNFVPVTVLASFNQVCVCKCICVCICVYMCVCAYV